MFIYRNDKRLIQVVLVDKIDGLEAYSVLKTKKKKQILEGKILHG